MNKPKLICRILWLCIFVSLSASVNAQLHRHQWLVGGALSGRYAQSKPITPTNNSTYTDKVYELTTPINIGYFVLPKWAIGIRGTYGYEKASSASLQWYYGGNTPTIIVNQFVAGIFTRYYFFSKTSRFNLYAEAAYAYGRSNTRYLISNSDIQSISNFNLINGNLAPVYFINKNVAFEMILSYAVQKGLDNNTNQSVFAPLFSNNTITNSFLLGFGLQVHLNQPKE